MLGAIVTVLPQKLYLLSKTQLSDASNVIILNENNPPCGGSAPMQGDLTSSSDMGVFKYAKRPCAVARWSRGRQRQVRPGQLTQRQGRSPPQPHESVEGNIQSDRRYVSEPQQPHLEGSVAPCSRGCRVGSRELGRSRHCGTFWAELPWGSPHCCACVMGGLAVDQRSLCGQNRIDREGHGRT